MHSLYISDQENERVLKEKQGLEKRVNSLEAQQKKREEAYQQLQHQLEEAHKKTR
ncbi:MAG: hypothetical protein K2X98_04885 [Alphaproteobacteria bacterium]|nr:hypothetical protein [Alphaproteobacteria bacterium]